MGGEDDAWLVALTSIHWREAWKYGERAFRYCQHDLGHAIAAIAIAAASSGGRCGCCRTGPRASRAPDRHRSRRRLRRRRARGGGLRVARQSSESPSRQSSRRCSRRLRPGTGAGARVSSAKITCSGRSSTRSRKRRAIPVALRPLPIPASDCARHLPHPHHACAIRRACSSSVEARCAFDGRGSIDARGILHDALARHARCQPHRGTRSGGTPRIHLLLFVHRVNGLDAGRRICWFAIRRRSIAFAAACGRTFDWTPAHASLPLFLLARGDCRALAGGSAATRRLPARGSSASAMLPTSIAASRRSGLAFYRHLFWESGVVGQMLYLEARRPACAAPASAVSTTIRSTTCSGSTGHTFQSLYHFTIGTPVEDTRLTTEPGYAWERYVASGFRDGAFTRD